MTIYNWVSLLVPVLVSVATGFISYKSAVKTANIKIKASEIEAKNEIDKIKESSDAEVKRLKEQYNHDLEKMKAETDEQIKLKVQEKEMSKQEKTDDIINQLAMEFIKNPDEMKKNLIGVEKAMPVLNKIVKEIKK